MLGVDVRMDRSLRRGLELRWCWLLLLVIGEDKGAEGKGYRVARYCLQKAEEVVSYLLIAR